MHAQSLYFSAELNVFCLKVKSMDPVGRKILGLKGMNEVALQNSNHVEDVQKTYHLLKRARTPYEGRFSDGRTIFTFSGHELMIPPN